MLLPVVAAGAVGVLAPYALIPMLKSLKVFDIPNSRSSHSAVALRGGGIAPMAALIVGVSLLFTSDDLTLVDGRVLLIVLVASIFAATLGWVEDYRGLPVRVRAVIQVVIGGLGSLSLAIVYEATWWVAIPAAFFIAGYVNVANFMDGVNGISAFHGFTVGAVFVLLGSFSNVEWLSNMGAIVAIAFLAFLPWNLRGKMFLGDVGSYLLGASIATISAAAALAGVPLLGVLGPLAIYLGDTGSTLVRRVMNGERWYEAHRSHTYQRLVDEGLSHLQVALLVAGFTALTSAAGLLSYAEGWWSQPASILLIVVICSIYLGLPRSAASGKTRHLESEVPRSEPQSVPPRTKVMPERWAVVGGSGFIGSALVRELRRQGEDVTALRAPRITAKPSGLAPKSALQKDRWSVDIAYLADSLRGVDIVINAAGMATPDGKGDDELFGANAVLPSVVAHAAAEAGCSRFVHLSSAAVQGRRRVLDESPTVQPFSPYSRSKALGESSLQAIAAVRAAPSLTIVRATSVQGLGRDTTRRLQRLARSAVASVARPGDQQTVVSSVRGLVDFVLFVGRCRQEVPIIVLQPWEGTTARSVMLAAGGKEPLTLPRGLCCLVVAGGYAVGRVVPRLAGIARRLELMWLGQEQDAAWARSVGYQQNSNILDVLRAAG